MNWAAAMTQCTVATVSAMGCYESGLFGISQPGASPTPDPICGPAPAPPPAEPGIQWVARSEITPEGCEWFFEAESIGSPEDVMGVSVNPTTGDTTVVTYGGEVTVIPAEEAAVANGNGATAWYLSPWAWLAAAAGWYFLRKR